MMKKTINTTIAIKDNPPTVPPTIAAVLLFDSGVSFLFVSLFELSVILYVEDVISSSSSLGILDIDDVDAGYSSSFNELFGCSSISLNELSDSEGDNIKSSSSLDSSICEISEWSSKDS